MEEAARYIDPEKGIQTLEEAIAGAQDILAEDISDDAAVRKQLRIFTYRTGKVAVKATDPKAASVYADIGAYNGDTIEEYVSYAGTNTAVYAFEPDARNYKKLCQNVAALGLPDPKLYNVAAWNENTELTFYARSGRNSAGSTVHKNAKAVTVTAARADTLLPRGADYINIDAEGSDLQVLQGLLQTLTA